MHMHTYLEPTRYKRRFRRGAYDTITSPAKRLLTEKGATVREEMSHARQWDEIRIKVHTSKTEESMETNHVRMVCVKTDRLPKNVGGQLDIGGAHVRECFNCCPPGAPRLIMVVYKDPCFNIALTSTAARHLLLTARLRPKHPSSSTYCHKEKVGAARCWTLDIKDEMRQSWSASLRVAVRRVAVRPLPH
jgi:hypothetical protein